MEISRHQPHSKKMSWVECLIIFLFLTNVVFGDSCIKDYDMMGCYEEKNPENLLFNDRENINWQDIMGYMQGLACKCAEAAKNEGYAGFALYYWGECYGRSEGGLQTLTQKYSNDNLCIGDQIYTTCNKEESNHCVGGDYAEAVYIFKKEAVRNIDGGFGEWQPWTKCDKNCGTGMRHRERNCDNPKPVGKGNDCSVIGDYTQSEACKVRDCPVHGGYGAWEAYSDCSKSCGGGVKSRKRMCNNPLPAFGGNDCSKVGPSSETETCNTHECPVDGGYGAWSDYSSCTKPCGGGTKTKTRPCDNPEPAYGGKDCSDIGPSSESATCNVHKCPVDGGYGPWTSFEGCSVSCGGGVKIRSRNCENPKPAYGGKDCRRLGPDSESVSCNTHQCPVDGGYSEWAEYSSCSKSCGGGIKTRRRSCDNPKPAHGGIDCKALGPDLESIPCNIHECPVDGGYGIWTEFGSCSKSCGGGIKTRKRLCNNPEPAHGGKSCDLLGPSTESRSCNTHECPVHGGFGDWGAFSSCSKSCGGGIRTRTRACDNPAPLHGGKDCSHLGAGSESERCNTHGCLVNGGYSQWTELSSCSATCGGGIRTRKRSCNAPKPEHGGKDCSGLGPDTETTSCNTFHCPVDGGYSEWGEYGTCSKTCGGGIQTRSRSCDQPEQAYGGKDCMRLGLPTQTRTCNTHECPVDGGYSEWSEYSGCSKSCGDGKKTRERTCDNPKPSHGGKDCSSLGPATEAASCKIKDCQVNGGYSEWSEYSDCSKSCGKGKKTRERTCDNPKPSHGGKDCSSLGPAKEDISCKIKECPVDGGYSEWGQYSICSKSCGGGTKKRSRNCTNPVPAHGGLGCSRIGPSTESAACNSHECPKLVVQQHKKQEAPICKVKYTNFRSSLAFAGGHQLRCGSDSYALSMFRLQRSGTNLRYQFKCCQMKDSICSLKPKTTQYSDENHGTIYNLDKHEANCGSNGYINEFKVERNPTRNKVRYRFYCCSSKERYNKENRVCYVGKTAFSDSGKGQLYYLDRQTVSCRKGFALSSFSLEQNSDHGKIRYLYTCCRLS